jgi:hydroxylaminobenzene mutase
MQPNRSLLFHGAVVLLLSLVAGGLIATPGVANPRMAAAAHVAGLLTGPILFSLGLAWSQLRLAPRTAALTERLLVVSLYLNFAFVLLAGLFGTSQATPIGGAGHGGSAWQELLVTAGLVVAVLGVSVAFVLVAVGFAGPAPAAEPE